MSHSVDRLKELLFNTETHALEELARRIDAISETEARTRDELTRRIETAAGAETRTRNELIERITGFAEAESRARADLARRFDGMAEIDARAREEFKRKLDEVYARAGNTEHMTASVAEILSDALRRAEVAKHMELSQTIAPLVVTTIKAELRNSQDEMVEALYPITGRLVKSYVASAVKDLTDQMNRRLEQNPLMLRLQSLTTGRSVGELALAGTQDFDVKELYLIRRGSGELVAHWPDKPISGREHAMSGVLAAVNEFANDAFSADQSSLRQIDLGGEEVYLRGSPIYLLAARCSGHAPKSIEQMLDDAFLSAVETQHRIDGDPAVAADPARAKAAALADLGTSLKSDVARELQEFKSPGGTGPLKMLAALILLPVLGWLAWGWYSDYHIATVRSSAERIIAADPAMLGYPAHIDVTDGGRGLTISGLTPSSQAKKRIVDDIKRSLPRIALSDRLSVVAGSGITIPDVSPELARVRQELSVAVGDLSRAAVTRTASRAEWRLAQAASDLARAAALATDKPQTEAVTRNGKAVSEALSQLKALAGAGDTDGALSSNYQALAVKLETLAGDLVQSLGGDPRAPQATKPENILVADGAPLDVAVEQVAANAERIAALSATIAVAKSLRAPAAPPPPAPIVQAPQPSAAEKLQAYARRHAVFFGANLDYRNPEGAAKLMTELAALIKASPTLVRLVGYTDEVGGQTRNTQLAQDRAEKVRRDLIAAGVSPGQLVAVGRANAIDLSDTRGAQSPNRRVEFELGFEGEAQP